MDVVIAAFGAAPSSRLITASLTKDLLMPNLAASERKRERDARRESARQQFMSLIVEILRAIERGDDREYRVHDKLVSYCLEVAKSTTPHWEITREAVQAAYRKAIDPHSEKLSTHEMEMRSIIGSALQVAAETMCSDCCARARASRRKEKLRISIEEHVSERQRRARKRAGKEPRNPWHDV